MVPKNISILKERREKIDDLITKQREIMFSVKETTRIYEERKILRKLLVSRNIYEDSLFLLETMCETTHPLKIEREIRSILNELRKTHPELRTEEKDVKLKVRGPEIQELLSETKTFTSVAEAQNFVASFVLDLLSK